MYYTYDADGIKLSKTVISSLGITTVHHYVKGFEHNKNRQLEFFATEEGQVVKKSTGFNYEYNITDHAGNVRVSFDKDPSTGLARLIQKDNYYPFGSLQPGSYVSGVPNKYLFNGKELQDELGMNLYDFGARMLDPLLGRFFVQDRFAEKYTTLSPYQYANNNPLSYIDVNGDSLWIIQGGNAPMILYYNGKLLNGDGSEYNDEITRFAEQAFNALNELGAGRDGKAMLEELEESTSNFKIEESQNNYYSMKTVKWDPSDTKGAFDTQGNRNRPAFIGLGHELAHALDDSRGTIDRTLIELRQGVKFPKAEHFSTFKENQFRIEHGLPLRKFFGTFINSNNNTEEGIYPLLENDRTSLHYNKGYDFIKNAQRAQAVEYRFIQRGKIYQNGGCVFR
jgi:RHS repeat-associated protein